ncbi:TlpA family protein disulfide reductase [Filimonas effusa]|uniref:TlpA family protein disulfide reductase n=1 Tax=Filimonas effusa TaxID=2508721 RepID=A0A4Q1D9Y9_9BACT|nr:TlpA disulfide reductase family protein [Filimonas effusa]RXK85708.1 TlpA family protein disulfide reductase [Filimonas effusa]
MVKMNSFTHANRLMAAGMLVFCLHGKAQQPAQQPVQQAQQSQQVQQSLQQAQAPQLPPVFSWDKPVLYHGDTLHVVYRPRGPVNTPVKGFAYLYKNFEWKGYDLSLTKTDTGWIGEKQIPEGAALICFRFYVADTIDKGNRWPYVLLIHDKNKRMTPGAYTEYALMRRRDIKGYMSDLVRPESLIEPRVAVALYVAKEWGDLTVRRNMFYRICMSVKEYFPPEKGDSIIRKGAAEIAALPDIKEQELLTIQRIYSRILNNNDAADSIMKIILAKYPNGIAFRQKQLGDVYRIMDKEKHLAAWDKFLETYPASKYNWNEFTDPVWGENSFFANSFTFQGNTAFMQHNLAEVKRLGTLAPLELLPYLYMHYVMFPFHQVQPMITDAEAYDIAKVYMDRMLKLLNDPNPEVSKRGIYAPSEWPRPFMVKDYEVFAHHVKLLFENREYAAASKLAAQVFDIIRYSDVVFNDVYVKLLLREKKNKEALEYIHGAIYANAFTAEMIKTLKADYLRNGKDEKNFPAYVISLKSKESIEKEQQAIRKAMVTVPAPAFSLSDKNDNKVSLAGLKGKIVVLDFWATWCHPCKAAMPGMQMAVDHFKNDKDIAFYFISTLEQNPRYKIMADSFVTAKKYDFTVLFDNKTDSSDRNDQAFEEYRKVLHFNGIPEKVIIDKNGIIRWWSSGGSENHIALAEEIKYVVELLKNEPESKATAK